MPQICVFPAAGALGTSTIKHLVKLVPASDLVLVARKPDALAELARAGATVRRADYEEPATLDRVFDGVDVLFLVSYASIEIQFRFEAHKHAIDAARRSGVKHIFYSSLGFAGDLAKTSVAHVMGAHLKTERYLAELQESSSGPHNQMTYTAVREGIYAESFPIYTSWLDLHHPPTTNEVLIPHPGDGPGVTWVKRDELGEATARLIADYARDQRGFAYVNRVLLLSGPREISLRETVEILGRVCGRPLAIRTVPVEDFVKLPQHGKKFFYHGIDLTREWATAWDAIRRGETAVVSPLLGQILGREPESYETTIQALYDSSG
ncbi:NmrA-like family protein [Aspergillus saccharolyticus JOP 1030-1]|uniref:NmrA-like family protein n=1 Tax=Aspergillus saccharolyticus JOP 1030-1 TaxID=1450539 RepID=A0A318ZQK4_9EURO|nr:NmrA-like family protein [Aspergillus saccharolyticus JOP 1030-1]PYH49786.1 NmrA-like family protein [Aspergillus saccharolyticus JOP 1030-1]